MSSAKIVAKIKQKNHYRTYVAGPCACWHCSTSTPKGSCENDWEYDKKTCCFTCPKQPKCSRLDPSTCPNIAGGAQAAWDDSPTVACTYNVDGFTALADIVEYKETWGTDDNYNKIIMPEFCALTSEECPNDELVCTNLTSTGEAGKLCQEWQKSTNGSVTPSDNGDQKTFWDKYKWWMIGAAGAFFLLLIIYGALISSAKKNGSNVVTSNGSNKK